MATPARTYLADALTTALGDTWRIVPWDENPTVAGPTVLLYRTSVAPTPEAPSGSWSHEFTLHVAGPRQIAGEALDELDGLLDDVLIALHGVPGVLWTGAEYGTLGGTVPSFKVTATVLTKPAEEEGGAFSPAFSPAFDTEGA